MIYFLSDLHGGESITGLQEYLSYYKPNDLLVLLGDVSLQFGGTAENERFTTWFLSLPCRIAMVDGNHENNAFLASFPEEVWCGGKVHRLSPTIVHLQRGYVYTIDGARFFVMGGCKSSAKWKEQGLWYEGEAPDETELRRGYDALRAAGHRVEYILTHAYWNDTELPSNPPPLTLEGLIRHIDRAVEFRHWYSGHRHWAGQLDARHTVVYDTPIPLCDE